MQLSNLPAKFPVAWASSAGSGYIKTTPLISQIGIIPGAASLPDGFVPLNMTPVTSGGKPAWGQDLNGILNWITAYMRFLQAGGIAPYDATYSGQIGGYPKNAILASSANVTLLWLNTIDNNTTNPDAGGASGWVATGPAALGVLATITPGTGVATALAVNVGSAGAPVIYNGGLGTPSSGALNHCSGLPVGGISGLGTGVATALAVNVGSAGAPVIYNGGLGTPSSGALNYCSGLPVGGISGLGPDKNHGRLFAEMGF